MELNPQYVSSLDEYLRLVKGDTAGWQFNESKIAAPWFRGQDRTDSPQPKLFRGKGFREFELTRMFRDRAGAFGIVPETDRLDKWLFLMQHYRAPTRLLDWTESPMIALFFALEGFRRRPEQERLSSNPAVWALHPLILNAVSGVDGFPNTWTRHDIEETVPGGLHKINQNPGVEFFRLAFHPKEQWTAEINLKIVELAIAIQPSYLDLRMYSQKSCFTIHGTGQHDIEQIFLTKDYLRQKYLYKYIIVNSQVDSIYEDLKGAGVTNATVFPDFEGISLDLAERFRN
jgi:hypothetical protein